MSKDTIVAPDVLEARVFGAYPQPSVWAQDLLSRLPLLHMSLDKSSIMGFEAKRVMMLRDAAINAARIGQQKAEEARPRSLPESEKLVSSLENLSVVRGIVHGRGLSSVGDDAFDEAIWMSLDLAASDLAEQSVSFEADFISEASGSLPGEPERMRRTIDFLQSALTTDGLSHDEQMRIAYAIFREHLRLNHGTGTPGMWLRMGWLLYVYGDDPIDAQRAVHEAARLSGRNKTITHWLACRFMAYIHSNDGQHDDAHKWIAQALQLRNDANTMIEGSIYAAACNKIRECRALLAHALTERPLLCLLPLANENFAEHSREVLGSMLEIEPKMRDSASGLLHQWQLASKRVHEAGQAIGRGEIASIHLLQGHCEGQKELKKADVFVSWYLTKTFDSSRRLLIDQAKATIEREINRCQDLIKEAERSIEGFVDRRELDLKKLQTSRDEAVLAARAEVRRTMRYEDTLDTGCGVSLGLAAVGFGIFAVVAAIGVYRGFAFGLETTMGQIVLGVAIAPVILTFLAEIAQSIARIRLDSAMQSRIEEIDRDFRNRAGAVDRACRESVEENRTLLEDRSRELRMCRDALRVINNNAKTVLRSAA